MSVLECGRVGCDNIMCRRVILGNAAYICEDCYDELLEYKKTWPSTMTKNEVRQRIEDFMERTPGASARLRGEAIDEEFARLTGSEDAD